MGLIFVLILAGIAAFTVPHAVNQNQALQKDTETAAITPAPTQLDGITIQDLSHE